MILHLLNALQTFLSQAGFDAEREERRALTFWRRNLSEIKKAARRHASASCYSRRLGTARDVVSKVE